MNARPNAPPVGFELGFTGTSRADAAAQSRKRRAGTSQPGQQVLQLGQLHLQLALFGPGPPRENVENELRAVDDLAAKGRFEMAHLRRGQLAVEDDDVDVQFGAGGGDHVDLAAAEKGRGIRLGPFLQHAQDDRCARRFGQAAQFVERAFGIEPLRASGDETDERGALGSCHSRSSHARTSSQPMAPARTSTGAGPVTSTMVEGGPPAVKPASSSTSMRFRSAARRRRDRWTPVRRSDSRWSR